VDLATPYNARTNEPSAKVSHMSPYTRQITFINTAHTFTHYSLMVLPTAVLAMAAPGGPFGEAYGPILALATGIFVLYGAFTLPQGWIAQRGRPPGADYGVFRRHRPVDGGDIFLRLAGDAGGDLGRDRVVRGDLPPDRHRDVGRCR